MGTAARDLVEQRAEFGVLQQGLPARLQAVVTDQRLRPAARHARIAGGAPAAVPAEPQQCRVARAAAHEEVPDARRRGRPVACASYSVRVSVVALWDPSRLSTARASLTQPRSGLTG
ncbi:hypothetical protein TN53_32635 [Streptomyces sp. WM6386]|nr:hypothetical protein TN53_32635 [Streptomyces sp. WM6386]